MARSMGSPKVLALGVKVAWAHSVVAVFQGKDKYREDYSALARV
jgi:hypothetical protein